MSELVVGAAAPAVVPVDVCRFCGCSGDCKILGEECGWRDEAHTVCTNPGCVSKHEMEKFLTAKGRFKGAKRSDQAQLLAKRVSKAAKKKSRARGAK